MSPLMYHMLHQQLVHDLHQQLVHDLHQQLVHDQYEMHEQVDDPDAAPSAC
jgi:hypothetical protein